MYEWRLYLCLIYLSNGSPLYYFYIVFLFYYIVNKIKNGVRYTCRIGGRETYLFYEDVYANGGGGKAVTVRDPEPGSRLGIIRNFLVWTKNSPMKSH